MAQVGPIRDAIQARLATIDGLKPYDVATGVERLPACIVFPTPTPGGQQRTACDSEEWTFLIEIHVSLAQKLPRAQDQLDAYISTTGTKSVRVAIDGDKTLGGVASTVKVGGFESYGFATLNETTTLAATIAVTVLA